MTKSSLEIQLKTLPNLPGVYQYFDKDDNIIYVNNVNYSHIHTECNIDDSIIYCGSFVLWFLGNHHRNNQSLFADIRSHRIFPKNIWEALDEL